MPTEWVCPLSYGLLLLFGAAGILAFIGVCLAEETVKVLTKSG
jgi:hypothetical protein